MAEAIVVSLKKSRPLGIFISSVDLLWRFLNSLPMPAPRKQKMLVEWPMVKSSEPVTFLTRGRIRAGTMIMYRDSATVANTTRPTPERPPCTPAATARYDVQK